MRCTFGLMIFHQFIVKKGLRCVLLNSEKLLLYYSRMYFNNQSFHKHSANAGSFGVKTAPSVCHFPFCPL